jgi:very-short-patch-repair endonuclease
MKLKMNTHRARKLRTTPNAAEQALWSTLKSRQLDDHKFTRQFPLGPYFADFACREHFLVVELDGSQHQDNTEYDHERDQYMLQSGYSVLRVPSASALNNLSGLCDTILAVLEGRMEDHVEAPDMKFMRSNATPSRRGFSSRSSIKRNQ